MAVSFSDLQLAIEFVSSGGTDENEAYLDRESGKIYWHSEVGDTASMRARRIYRSRPRTPYSVSRPQAPPSRASWRRLAAFVAAIERGG
jgi:hypothetical protein